MKAKAFAVIALLFIIASTAGAATGTPANNLAQVVVDIMRRLFGLDQSQVSSIWEIIRSWGIYGDGDKNKLAYIMATAWHESRLRPVKEIKGSPNSQLWIQYQSKYWTSGYYGRGFVQLTWERNYQKMSDFLGVDLVGNPDLALEPRYAADILVYGMMQGSFTGKKLSDYINESGVDFRYARRIVNGTQTAELMKVADLIAGYATQIKTDLA